MPGRPHTFNYYFVHVLFHVNRLHEGKGNGISLTNAKNHDHLHIVILLCHLCGCLPELLVNHLRIHHFHLLSLWNLSYYHFFPSLVYIFLEIHWTVLCHFRDYLVGFALTLYHISSLSAFCSLILIFMINCASAFCSAICTLFLLKLIMIFKSLSSSFLFCCPPSNLYLEFWGFLVFLVCKISLLRLKASWE